MGPCCRADVVKTFDKKRPWRYQEAGWWPSTAQLGLVQRRFDARTPGAVEVMNVAWADWGTRDHIKAVYEMIQTYDVDEVVLCYLPNDIAQIIPVTEEFDPTRPPRAIYVRTDNSFLLDYLFHRVYAPRFKPSAADYFDWLAGGFDDPEIWRTHQDDFGRLIQTCREHDVTLRVAIQPLLLTTGTYDASRIHGGLVAFFQRVGVPVVDLREAVENHDPDTLVVNPHDAHPNEIANRLFADAIWASFFTE